MTFTAAIVGRPNVGKSTLFNRLTGRRLALVDNTPGVTRDRREGTAELGDLRFTLVDTAGLEDADAASLAGRMTAQTKAAIEQVDLCLFLIDARAGVTPADRHFADVIRRTGTPVVLIANKSEGKAGEAGLYEAYGLGLGEPIALSAEHGEGTADLYEALSTIVRERAVRGGGPEGTPSEPDEELAEQPADGDTELGPDRPLKIAIVGRPNAGKSTFINRLLGEERLLTGAEAGITRDAIAVDTQWRDQPIRLIDTAGMRKKAQVVEKLEKLSVGEALRAIRFAEVVVLVIDATQPFEKQDLHIADLVAREGRALVIAVNKWDLIEDRAGSLRQLRETCDRLLPQLRGVPLVTMSALDGTGLSKVMDAAFAIYRVWNRRLGTGELNRWLQATVERHSPPATSGRRIKLRYATQPKSRPPTFIVFCSKPENLPSAYTRYLVNALREDFDLWGVPIRIHLRKGKNPYAD